MSKKQAALGDIPFEDFVFDDALALPFAAFSPEDIIEKCSVKLGKKANNATSPGRPQITRACKKDFDKISPRNPGKNF